MYDFQEPSDIAPSSEMENVIWAQFLNKFVDPDRVAEITPMEVEASSQMVAQVLNS